MKSEVKNLFRKVLIANRGEIACRIVRACEELGIISAAVYSEADHQAEHVKMADEAYLIGPAPVKESYLNIHSILQAAKDAGADAVHPGYGLLSENADFAKKCEREDITFIGPSPESMELMGDKISARKAMKNAEIPIIPGINQRVESVEAALKDAEQIGYPVMLKASAGGGGIGMQKVNNEKELRKAFEGNKKRASDFFGNGTLYIEKIIEHARHVEIQILADQHGNVIHLGERDCSIQRRNQKVLEESPSPFINAATRQKMGEAAIKAAEHIGYRNAGTIEFLVDDQQQFYFLEMNTRLQVEHPVTEEVTNVDIVQWQLRVASGEILHITQDSIIQNGHALEARIYAEDPSNFFPSPGKITALTLPRGEHIRHECGVREGIVVTPHYDPMIAKIITTGKDRHESINQMISALNNYHVEGIKTNIPMILEVLNHQDFKQGQTTTAFVTDILRSTNV
ncbi:acetyl-CoA carboxylase, biotin carboxylase subunit [Alteribacillus bidgolensis]|uniref:biotin carboxylase n=1 Tax=Alteribacillus bidgolensis TaxID=930129 RepID=A0A1G8N1Y8_9BACI|nr:acetyl-CoA carboxylase, biotin carboxylase subunit [Alteribacillus bidgolensis]